ncbi:MAG: hypothetical protein QUS09_11025, partial [Methanotrichaceae archaeon]|nr:hypothetical protein [Methanotrichaceae archaeon]
SVALDTKVYTLCERNLSLNLSEDFRIIADENGGDWAGFFSQSFTIANKQSKGMAMLQIMDVYDEDMKALGPDFISQSWVMGVSIGASLLSSDDGISDRVIGNWTAVDPVGNNVNVNTITNNNSLLSAFGKTADVASWNIGDDRYAGLVSFYDKNTTKQIIGTLVVN